MKIADGRHAEVLAWGEGRVLKLMRTRDEDAKRELEREERALEAAFREGAPVPAAHGRIEHEGRPGLIVERVDGPDLLWVLERRPWTVASVARDMGVVHARLHEIAAPRGLPDLRTLVRERIVSSALVPPPLSERALRLLDALGDGDRLCHGDFHPANVLTTAAGLRVVDWAGATRGDPAGDVARTRLLLLIAVLPDDASPTTRILARIGRRALWSGYRRSYRRTARSGFPGLDAWWIVGLVERLTHGIAGEREPVLRILESLEPRGAEAQRSPAALR